MASLLLTRDSTAVHITQSRRHQRLARRYRQVDLADGIEPAIAELQKRSLTAAERDLDRQSTYDDLQAADADLDDGVRNVYSSAEIFDRENPTTPVLRVLFPEGRFTDITDTPVAKEPAEVEALATRIAHLGADHRLASHAATLRKLAQEVIASLAAQETAIRASKAADAEEEIAAAALRRQYEANCLDARKRLARPLAERLFPAGRTSPAATEEPAPSPAPQG